ncbi:cysteine-rich protein 1-like [Parasteatoda tepidariorum]|uniref:cysteine-rich protein 1-like n=1 Tax=Parasteatoda tepidariorum TaxID=114398 RepID=UPI001C722C2C|nr:cysteine-rich protein 1-like [Parasteatoda tepidariorum]
MSPSPNSNLDLKNEFDVVCPTCGEKVYNAEKVIFMKRLWHRNCLRCYKCNKVLEAVKAYVDEGKPYCPKPCYYNRVLTKGYCRPSYS